MMHLKVQAIRPKSQLVLATAMFVVVVIYAQSFPSWWQFAVLGVVFGLISGGFWWGTLNSAPLEISSATNLVDFLRLLHSTMIGKLQRLLEWAVLGIMLYLASVLSTNFSFSGVIICGAVYVTTSSAIRIFAVISYEKAI